jgi:hypothetical protein
LHDGGYIYIYAGLESFYQQFWTERHGTDDANTRPTRRACLSTERKVKGSEVVVNGGVGTQRTKALRHSIDISHIQSPDSLGMICERESH